MISINKSSNQLNLISITSITFVISVLIFFVCVGCQSPYAKYSVRLNHDVPRCIFLSSEEVSQLIGTDPIIEENRAKFFQFCAQPHGRQDRSIQTLYISPYLDNGDYRYLERNPEGFAEFLREAHYLGFKVEYLSSIGGLMSASERAHSLQELDMVVKFNNSRPAKEQWDGIHYDFEPHQFAQWQHNADAIWARNHSYFQQARTKINEHKIKNASGFKLGLSIPSTHTPESFNDILDIIDYVGIVSYHDRTQTLIKEISPILDAARASNKKAWIITLSSAPDKTSGITDTSTFAGEGHSFLETSLDEIHQELQFHPGLEGFGYHEFQTYHDLNAVGDIVRAPSYAIVLNQDVPRSSFISLEDLQQVIGMTPTIENNRQRLFEFCAQPHGSQRRSIQTLYLKPDWQEPLGVQHHLVNHPEDFAQFLREAHYHGFKIEYLAATQNLRTDAEKAHALQELDAVLQYNSSRPPQERWDGIHYDFDPGTFAEWKQNADSILALKRSFFQEARLKIDNLTIVAPSEFKIGYTLPASYATDHTNDLFDYIDYIGVVSNHDRLQSIVKEVNSILDAAKSHNSKVWILTRSMQPNPELGITNTSTFAGEGHQFLDTTLDQIHNEFDSHTGLEGFGYHKFNTYRNLEAEGDVVRAPSYSIALNHDVPRCTFLWIEDSKLIIGIDPTIQEQRQEVFEFCARPHGYQDRSIQTLFISPYLEHPHGDYRYLERHPEDFAQFLREAHYHGFKVEYLSSIGGLITDDEKNVTLAELDMVLDYNNSRPLEERWDGIHYDIEPHTFDEWQIDSESIWARNRSFFQEARSVINQYLLINPAEFKMGLSIPTFHTGDRLNDILDAMDYIGIMSYHDRTGTITEASRPILDAADSHNKKAWIFTESMPPSQKWGVARSNSFSEEGYQFLESTLDEVYNIFRLHSGFEGFGYHEFKTYRILDAEGYDIRNQQSFGGIINNFNHSEHDLEGKVVAYAKPPSFISSGLVMADDENPENKALRLAYSKQPNSWCGWVTVLTADGEFIDLSEYSHICFKIRGHEGGETFTVGLADKKWHKIDDSVQSKDISDYLPEEVTTNWQDIRIPLSHFRGVVLSEIASVGFNFNNRNSMNGAVFIDDLRFE